VIVLRETLEAAIIVSVLLSLVQNLVFKEPDSSNTSTFEEGEKEKLPNSPTSRVEELESSGGITSRDKKLVRKMKIQVRYFSFLNSERCLILGHRFS
jgi:high-affinity iron transporter